MLTGSLRLGTISQIVINAHWSVVVVAVVLGGSLAPTLGWPLTVVAVVLFLASILVHELAHALTARRFGVGTLAIELWALGGVARLDRESPSARAEAWIAAAGPLSSCALAVAGVGAWQAVDTLAPASAGAALVAWVAAINVALAVFNLLPGAPLDGGRVLKAARWRRHGDRYRADRDAAAAGAVIGAVLAVLGLWMLLTGRPGIWVLLTGGFVWVHAYSERISSRLAERLAGVSVRELTWFGLASADARTDADAMLGQRQRLGGAGVVGVQRTDGTLEGLVLEEQLWAIPEEQRPWVLLAHLMVPLGRVARADVREDLAAVLPRLDAARPILTVWDGDRLLGVVPPGRLRDRLGLSPAG